MSKTPVTPPFRFPDLITILAALRMIDQWLTDEEAAILVNHPEYKPQLDAILAKLKTAESLTATWGPLMQELSNLASGNGPVTPDDVDLA